MLHFQLSEPLKSSGITFTISGPFIFKSVGNWQQFQPGDIRYMALGPDFPDILCEMLRFIEQARRLYIHSTVYSLSDSTVTLHSR